ncbi:putative AC9 transposase [Fusarium oxysporum f. sp. conglutinans]|nr:putative AC9 transposase [Fusarium oxysporum f. sp. conglutinans]KAG6980297.1 putative AC9 transposase [Fusarium oxysporum f. sp. conglutinans]KAG6998740.1 putative AC9 transposase [Fusarium oxysporum f. sp. conglutinans]KAG7002455.1 putative AC9 transposase [Fusarium oxysporum f. sp. conglutinans]
MSETALKGSIISSPSPSPPPTFPHLGSRPKSIAKQYAAALALASTTDSSVHDLHKITWGQRRFVIASLLDRRKSRGRRSWIGNHGWFLAELKRDNTSSGDIWCCRLCDDKGAPRFFNAQSTSSAQAHLYKLAHRITETFEPGSFDDSSVLDLQRCASKKRPASSSLVHPRAKMARIRELSVGYIIDSNLPFSTFESAYLQELFRQLDSDFYAQIPWGRTSAKKELEDILSLKKAAVREELDEAVTQIHINFNLWTSPNRLAFISIFGHFIDRSNSHQSRLHAFRRQIGSHAGENIAYTVRNVVRDWGIDRKIGVSICDNAASNDVCLRNFYTNLDASITRADAEARRMRCFGHILNLVAQAFLYGDDAASFELQSEAYGMLERVEEDLEHWRAKGPVGKLHNIVKFIRASPQRTEAFKAHAREQEEADIYKLAEESTAELEVIQNNATRWNSTYMMIERALVKQSELNSFIQDLGLEADASKRVPMADMLTSDDWKVLREVSHILEPIYNMTMRTQGWGTSGGHGRLWEVMTGMEYILEHLEDWRLLYEDETANHATEERRRAQGEELESVADTKSMSARPFVVRQTRERPLRQSRLPSRLQGFEITPLHRRRETVLSACPSTSPLFNEGALPVHSRGDYLQDDARSVSNIASMEGQERASIRASINAAWIKLNEYYTLLGRSPLFAASVVLNPDLGLRWLETNWTSPEQLQWLRDAKDGIKAYFERWYSKNDDDSSESISATSSLTPRPEQSRFEQWVKSRQPKLSATGSELERYYRLEPEQVDDPVLWWIDHSNAFPRLSRFALDVLAIPAMSTDCERAFSLAKLTVSSQRHSLLGSSIESIQLLKNWIKGGCVTLGGLCLSNKAVRSHGQDREAGNSST